MKLEKIDVLPDLPRSLRDTVDADIQLFRICHVK